MYFEFLSIGFLPKSLTILLKVSIDASTPSGAPEASDNSSPPKVPPKSFAPAVKDTCANQKPIFTQDTWIFGIKSLSINLATAYNFKSSVPVAPKFC